MQLEEDGGDISFFAPKAKRRKASIAAKRSDGADPAQPASPAPAEAKGRPLIASQPSSRRLESTAQHGEPISSPNGEDSTTGVEAASGGSNKSGTEAEAAVAPLAEEPPEGTTFRQLGLNEWLDRVCRSLGMAQPTQVCTATCTPLVWRRWCTPHEQPAQQHATCFSATVSAPTSA